MKHYEIKGQIREVGNKATIKACRAQGLVPCNLYGLGMENVLFTITEKDINALLSDPASYIIDVNLGDKCQMAIVHELQFHPVSDKCLHVDFLAVNEEKPIAINVPLSISGHAAGVQKGGKFVQKQRKVRISATMANLPDQLNLDITNLEIGENVVAGDLKYENITVLTQKDTIICGVKATRNSSK